MQSYQKYAPPELLRPFIKFFWALESAAPVGTSKTFRAIVDGCPGAIILPSDNDAFCDEHKNKLPGLFLYGQTIKPVKFSASGPLKVIGICLQPHALKAVFGFDADELTSSCMDLGLTSGKKQGNLSERLSEAGSTEKQLKLLSDHFMNLSQNNRKTTDDATNYAVTRIIQAKGDISLKDLQQQLQVSERNLQRRFRQAVGISPKLFSRICRFQESLDQMRKSNYNKLSDLAYDNEYADQSHFIRVFKEFTGFSPLDFKKQSQEVVENFPQISQ